MLAPVGSLDACGLSQLHRSGFCKTATLTAVDKVVWPTINECNRQLVVRGIDCQSTHGAYNCSTRSEIMFASVRLFLSEAAHAPPCATGGPEPAMGIHLLEL